MGAITSDKLTITVNARDRVRVNQKSMVLANVAFTTGSDTYPVHGIPLPAIGAFGMKKAIDFVNVMQNPADGYFVKYDKTYHTLRLYVGAAVAAHTHTFTGDALATHTHSENAADTYTKAATTGATSGGTPAGTIDAATPAGGALTEFSGTVPTIAVDLQVWGE
jgi:hypothetical protein